MKYVYGMRLRPFGIGCQPKDGLIGCEPVVIDAYWDVISYDRALTAEEQEHYGLDFLEVHDD